MSDSFELISVLFGSIKADNVLKNSLQLQKVVSALEDDLPDLCSQMSENEVVELSTPVMSVDNQRLQVLTRNAEGKMLSLLFVSPPPPPSYTHNFSILFLHVCSYLIFPYRPWCPLKSFTYTHTLLLNLHCGALVYSSCFSQSPSPYQMSQN